LNSRQLSRCLPAALVALSVASATFNAARHIEWNLDGLFYAALMSSEHRSAQEAHRSVYEEIAALAPPSAAHALTRGSPNRVELQQSNARFIGQLPFYVTKPLYIALGRVCTTFGAHAIHAPYIVSLISFVLLGLSVPMLAVAAGADRTRALILATLVVWLPFFRELGSLATPDATSTMLLTAGAAASMIHAGVGGALLTAATLARPDAAVLGAAIFCATQNMFPPRPLQLGKFLFVMALLSLPFVVAPATGGYGWSALIRHTFLESVSNNVEAQRGITISEYLTALENGARGAMTKQPANFLPYLALALCGCIFRRPSKDSLRQATALQLIAWMWIATLVRFLAMPLLSDRFFAPAYICSLAATFGLMAPSAPVHNERVPAKNL